MKLICEVNENVHYLEEADEKGKYGSIVPVIATLKEMDVSMNLVIRPKPK